MIYLGPIPHDSLLLRSAYRGCEFFALPSTLETPGLAALEAAAQGASLVITSEGSCEEYFGESAMYVDPLSSESIEQGIRKAFDVTPAMAKQKIRDKFAWANGVKYLAETYQAVLDFVH